MYFTIAQDFPTLDLISAPSGAHLAVLPAANLFAQRLPLYGLLAPGDSHSMLSPRDIRWCGAILRSRIFVKGVAIMVSIRHIQAGDEDQDRDAVACPETRLH